MGFRAEALRGVALITLAAWSPEASAQAVLYSVERGAGVLRIIEPTDGRTLRTFPLTLPGHEVVGGTGIAFDAATCTTFATLKLADTEARELVTLDVTTGEATSIGSTGQQIAGIALAADGTLFGVTTDQAATPETLFTLDVATGVPTIVLALGNGTDGETIAFNPLDGLLYHASGSGLPDVDKILETIDPDSLEIAPIQLSGEDYHQATALSFYPVTGGFLLADEGPPGAPAGALFHVTPDGLASPVGPLDHFSKGLGFVDLECGGGDRDGDGIPDEADACPDSDLAPSLRILGCDTGVDNRLTDEGCTLADEFSACESVTRNHGQLVKCFGSVARDLKDRGWLVDGESSEIKRCINDGGS